MTHTDANSLLLEQGPGAVRTVFDRALGAQYFTTVSADSSAPDMSILRRNAMAAPVFPLLALGHAQRWVEASAACKNAPTDYVALALIAASAGMLGAKRRASPWDGWTEPSIIWAALVGPPSFSKSPATDDIRDAVSVIERERNADWSEKQSEHEEARKIAEAKKTAWEQELAKACKSKLNLPTMPRDAEPPKPPTRHRIWIVDSTTEKVARLLEENPGGLLCFRDEFSGLLGGFDRYGGNGGDRAFWLEAYGGRPYRYDRVSLKEGSIDIPFNAVSLIGGIQPDKLNSLVLSGDDDGLAARPIYAWPDVGPPRRPTRSPDNVALVSALRRLSDLQFDRDQDGNPKPRTLLLESEAADEFQAWWERIQWNAKQEVTGKLAGAVGKLDGTALRLALVIEHVAWAWAQDNASAPENISLGSVQSALRIIEEWCRPNLARVFAEAAIPEPLRDAREVAMWLVKHRPEQINARELRRQAGFTGPREAKRLDAAIEVLVEARWLVAPPKEGTGRPRKDFQVDERVYEAPRT